jgi:hypothetical protein
MALLLGQSLIQPAQAAQWQDLDLRDVDVDVVLDRSRRSLPEYPVDQDGRRYRAYLEAEQGSEYSIRIRNRSDRRVGLVVAVDGRNIISGERSELHRKERMYILNPYQEATYRGWRSSKNEVNRFYFTDAPDSYAGRWGDHSAMGVIAVAAFAEKRQQYHKEESFSSRQGQPRVGAQRSAPANEPGTGHGDSEWSPSRQVEFDAEGKAFARYFLKYEWRSTLCEKGIIRCHRDDRTRRPGNRLWNDDGFAAPPPGRDFQQNN